MLKSGFLTIKGVPYMSEGLSVTYAGEAKGDGVTHHLFRSQSGWLISVTEIDFEIGNAVYEKKPVKMRPRMKSSARRAVA